MVWLYQLKKQEIGEFISQVYDLFCLCGKVRFCFWFCFFAMQGIEEADVYSLGWPEYI